MHEQIWREKKFENDFQQSQLPKFSLLGFF